MASDSTLVVATFNVNSVRARLPVLEEWLTKVQPDVVALQELKAQDDQFPFELTEKLGYHTLVHGQPRYNGVAILSKHTIEDPVKGFPGTPFDDTARICAGTICGIRFINTYVPNGTAIGSEKFEYKLGWFAAFREYLAQWQNGPALWLGDINVAPTDIDVYEPETKQRSVCFTQEEKDALARITCEGWIDVFRDHHPEPDLYTYWEYFIPNGFRRNLGWRIDHFYATPELEPRIIETWIDKEPRSWEKPSDHTPVLGRIQL